MIDLGDKVKDTVTGFTGIAVSITDYLHGCQRIGVQAIVRDNEPPKEVQGFDEPQLKIVKKKVVEDGKKDTGGPRPMLRAKKTQTRR